MRPESVIGRPQDLLWPMKREKKWRAPLWNRSLKIQRVSPCLFPSAMKPGSVPEKERENVLSLGPGVKAT